MGDARAHRYHAGEIQRTAVRQGAAWAAEHPAAAGDEGVYTELTAVYRESALARTRHLKSSPADGMARDAALFEAAWIVGALER